MKSSRRLNRFIGTVGKWVLVLSIISCSQKKEPKLTQLSPPSAGPYQESVDVPNLSTATTVTPERLKGKWKAVKLLLEDRKEKSLREYVVPLGATWTVPGSSITVQVEEFLPDLIIQGTVFTSATDELKNPAVHVRILENGKEVFKGWLFSLFPMMHPFQHERFGVTLKDAVAS